MLNTKLVGYSLFLLYYILFQPLKVHNSHVVTGAIEILSIEKFNKYIVEENAPFFILLLIINIIRWNHKILLNINANIAELITFNERDNKCTEFKWMRVYVRFGKRKKFSRKKKYMALFRHIHTENIHTCIDRMREIRTGTDKLFDQCFDRLLNSIKKYRI